MLTLLSSNIKLLRGESYWRVTLSSGKVLTEGQRSFDFLRGWRSVDWYIDIVGNRDCQHIKDITLCVPDEDVTLTVHGTPPEPECIFQFKQGTKMLLTGGCVANAHVVGRVDNKKTGECTAIIWDALERRLYTHATNIFDFSPWREGVVRIGLLNYPAMGVVL